MSCRRVAQGWITERTAAEGTPRPAGSVALRRHPARRQQASTRDCPRRRCPGFDPARSAGRRRCGRPEMGSPPSRWSSRTTRDSPSLPALGQPRPGPFAAGRVEPDGRYPDASWLCHNNSRGTPSRWGRSSSTGRLFHFVREQGFGDGNDGVAVEWARGQRRAVSCKAGSSRLISWRSSPWIGSGANVGSSLVSGTQWA